MNQVNDTPMAKFLRLQNGDDVVAETVEYEDDDGVMYMLINPMKVVYMQSQHDGYLSVSFIPWVFPKIVEHQEFMVHAGDVLLVSDVSEKMNIYYWDNLKMTQDKSDPEPEIPQEETHEQETLSELVEMLNTKRTYH